MGGDEDGLNDGFLGTVGPGDERRPLGALAASITIAPVVVLALMAAFSVVLSVRTDPRRILVLTQR